VIVARIPDVLDVKRYIRRLSENTESVIAFDDLFRNVIKSPISQHETNATGCQIIPVVPA
jgi:hypothetical protein